MGSTGPMTSVTVDADVAVPAELWVAAEDSTPTRTRRPVIPMVRTYRGRRGFHLALWLATGKHAG